MKKLFLFSIIITFSFALFAQKDVIQKINPINLNVQKILKRDFKVVEEGSKDIPIGVPIGLTNYDLQSNSAVARRMIGHGDGTFSAVWIQYHGADMPTAPERGTGYNYYDGTSWIYTDLAGANETIEGSQRTGWPTISIDGEGNELVLNHMKTDGGNFGWTQAVGASNSGWTQQNAVIEEVVSWPRSAQSGQTVVVVGVGETDFTQNIHNPVVMRSTNGGVDFVDITANIDFSSQLGVQGDSYAIAGRDDVFAFVVFSGMNDVAMWKSIDAGVTWVETTIVDLPIVYHPEGNVLYDENGDGIADVVCASDGTGDIIIDSQGNVHVVWSRMNSVDDDPAGAGNSFFPYTDWILYWNEGMGAGHFTEDAILPWVSDEFPFIIDSLNISSMVDTIGYCPDLNSNGEYDFPDVGDGNYPFGMYYGALSSFSSIGIDADDNLYVVFATIMEGGDYLKADAEPNEQQFRHVWGTKYNGEAWGPIVELTTPDGKNAENVYPSMATEVDDNIHFWIQWDPEPGCILKEETDPITQNYIVVKTIPITEFPDATAQTHSVTFSFYCGGGDELTKVESNFNWGFKNSGMANNTVTYTNVPAGTYDYSFERNGYDDVTGQLTVSGDVVDEQINFGACIDEYNVIFTVLNEATSEPVVNARVSFSQFELYTDDLGQASFIGFVDGTYNYQVTMSNYEPVTDEVVIDGENVELTVNLTQLVSINEIEDKVNIYPNPTTNYFTITNANNANITIYNIVGLEIMNINSQNSEQIIDIAQYPVGTYIIKVTNEQGTTTKKIIKQ